MSVLAITGGTGFVGKRLIDLALREGHPVRALTRRPQPTRDGIDWIEGALDRPDTLIRLVAGTGAVIHVAGVVNAPGKAGFMSGNIDGTRAVIAAAEHAGVERFVQVSSLAAREPALSSYGWSKAEADALVMACTLDWTIVRPPGIYGPGDLEQLDLFKLAKHGLALLPPAGRLSVVHVDDLARLLLALALTTGSHTIIEASDGTPGGYSHVEFAHAIGTAVGRRVLALPLPRPLLSLAARADGLLRGKKAKLTRDRVGYFCHPDWTSDPAKAPPQSLWMPTMTLAKGLSETASWYRANGLL